LSLCERKNLSTKRNKKKEKKEEEEEEKKKKKWIKGSKAYCIYCKRGRKNLLL
jgi:hypothetical protein